MFLSLSLLYMFLKSVFEICLFFVFHPFMPCCSASAAMGWEGGFGKILENLKFRKFDKNDKIGSYLK